jgi:hypothetical protein
MRPIEEMYVEMRVSADQSKAHAFDTWLQQHPSPTIAALYALTPRVPLEQWRWSEPIDQLMLAFYDWVHEADGFNASSLFFCFAPFPPDAALSRTAEQVRGSFLHDRVAIRVTLPVSTESVHVENNDMLFGTKTPIDIATFFFEQTDAFWHAKWKHALQDDVKNNVRAPSVHASFVEVNLHAPMNDMCLLRGTPFLYSAFFRNIPTGSFTSTSGRIDPACIELMDEL